MVNEALRGDNMRDEDIHIGDVLRIRRWCDLGDELGLDENGKIKFYIGSGYDSIPFWFSPNQRYLCGQTFTVNQIKSANGGYFYSSQENVERSRDRRDRYIIVADMLEPFEEDELEIATDEDIKALFG